VVQSGYCGRFAPSPTGPLHAGSILAAVASYLDAKANRGRWLVRIEDIDPAREVPGASRGILMTLEALGLEWDGQVVYQSERREAYAAALEALKHRRLAYPCRCSRREITRIVGPTRPGAELRYPGTCRGRTASSTRDCAWRFVVPDGIESFTDRLQGPQAFDVGARVGDFVVKRRDGPFAYQLAVVVDDAHAGVTHVVRGYDLLDNTPRQSLLQRALDLPTPVYAHVPLLIDDRGNKLSKSTQAPPVEPRQASTAVWNALETLRCAPPRELFGAPPQRLLAWAAEHCSLARVAGMDEVQASRSDLGTSEVSGSIDEPGVEAEPRSEPAAPARRARSRRRGAT
jgi:glutamyl-Q tRNA(Asp) synthetase